MAEAVYDPVTGSVEIEDLGDDYATFVRGGKSRYWAHVSENFDLPREHLKVWRNHAGQRFLIYDPVPRFSEIFERKLFKCEIPKDKNAYLEMCRVVARVETIHEFGDTRHIVYPIYQDKANLEEYINESIFYNRLDSFFMPILRGQ